mgnify:CR=1 FL=1
MNNIFKLFETELPSVEVVRQITKSNRERLDEESARKFEIQASSQELKNVEMCKRKIYDSILSGVAYTACEKNLTSNFLEELKQKGYDVQVVDLTDVSFGNTSDGMFPEKLVFTEISWTENSPVRCNRKWSNSK